MLVGEPPEHPIHFLRHYISNPTSAQLNYVSVATAEEIKDLKELNRGNAEVVKLLEAYLEVRKKDTQLRPVDQTVWDALQALDGVDALTGRTQGSYVGESGGGDPLKLFGCVDIVRECQRHVTTCVH